MSWARIPSSGTVQHYPPGTEPNVMTLGAPVSVNDRIILVIGLSTTGAAVSITSVIDDQGNSYHQDLLTTFFSSQFVLAFYSANSTTNGTPSITVTWSDGTGGSALAAAAYSGLVTALNAVDGIPPSATGSSTTPNSGDGSVTTEDSELAIGGFMNGGEGLTFTAGSGFTTVVSSANGNADIALEEASTGGVGSAPAATGSLSPSGDWVMGCVVYKLLPIASLSGYYPDPAKHKIPYSNPANNFASRLLGAVPLLFQSPTTSSGVIPTQPDTYQAPVVGASTATGVAQSRLLSSAKKAAVLGWTLPEDVNGPVIQPDSYQPPVQGVQALRNAAASWNKNVLIASPLTWSRGPDPLVQVFGGNTAAGGFAVFVPTEPRQIGLSFATTIWGFPQDNSAPLPTQPDTYQSPVRGTSSLLRTQQLFWSEAVQQTQLSVFAPGDLSNPGPVNDTYQFPLPGSGLLLSGQLRFTTGVAQNNYLLWNIPQDQSGTAATPPDTYQSAVQGVSSLQRYRGSYLRNVLVGVNQILGIPADFPAAITPPDTYSQPTAGTASLRLVLNAFSSRVAATALLNWATPQDTGLPPGTQPDTYQQSIQGTVSLSMNQLQQTKNAIRSTQLPSLPAPTYRLRVHRGATKRLIDLDVKTEE